MCFDLLSVQEFHHLLAFHELQGHPNHREIFK